MRLDPLGSVMRLASAAILVWLVLPGGIATAQTAERGVAKALRTEWQRFDDPPRITGYVYNDSSYRVGQVRLRLSTRDDPGQAPGEMLAWVQGNVPAHGRWSFSVRVPPQREVLGVTIESFVLI